MAARSAPDPLDVPGLQPVDDAAFTEADVSRLPDNGCRYEIFDGSLLVTPPANDTHQDLNMGLASMLRTALRPSGWIVRPEAGVALTDSHKYVPDVAVFFPGTPRTGALYIDAKHVALVVEVASDTTVERDRGVKRDRYAQAGIPMYWQIDYASDVTIHVHSRPEDGSYTELTTVWPGERLGITEPFAFPIDTDEIASEAFA